MGIKSATGSLKDDDFIPNGLRVARRRNYDLAARAKLKRMPLREIAADGVVTEEYLAKPVAKGVVGSRYG